jgi:hypothetical protein
VPGSGYIAPAIAFLHDDLIPSAGASLSLTDPLRQVTGELGNVLQTRTLSPSKTRGKLDNEAAVPSRQDQLVALSWVRGEMDLAAVAKAYGLMESASNQIFERLSRALKTYLQQHAGSLPRPTDNQKT